MPDEIRAARYEALDAGRVRVTDDELRALVATQDIALAPARAAARELLEGREAERQSAARLVGLDERGVRLRLGEDQALAFAGAYLELLRNNDDGTWSNFIELTVEGPAVREAGIRKLTVTVQRHDGLTPAEKLNAAEAEAAFWRFLAAGRRRLLRGWAEREKVLRAHLRVFHRECERAEERCREHIGDGPEAPEYLRGKADIFGWARAMLEELPGA